MNPLGGILPVRYLPPPRAAKVEQIVILNWLEVEVPRPAAVDEAKLQRLLGWRNREVYEYIKFVAPDWTARMFGGGK